MKEQHKVIILGKIVEEKYYYGGYSTQPYLSNIVKEHKTIYEGLLDNPPLNCGDDIFIHTINKQVTIDSIVRSTDNGYVYYTDYVIERIVDPDSIETSRVKTFKEFEEYMLKRKQEIDEHQKAEEEKRKEKSHIKYNKLPWYKKLFAKKPF